MTVVLLAWPLWRPALGMALQVAPARREIELAPGKRIKAEVSVTNDAKERVHVYASTKDWFVLPENKSIGIAQWLKVKGKTDFWLNPGESRQVPITIFCPPKAQGELVGMVSFLYQTAQPSMITPIISVSVYAAVKGTIKEEGQIKELGLGLWKDKLHVGVNVLSTGNVHLRPTGQIVLSDTAGKSVLDCFIKEGDPAYPGHDRGYVCPPTDLKLSPGHYAARADMNYHDLKMTARREFDVSSEGKIVMQVQKS